MHMKERVLCLYSQALCGTWRVAGTRCSGTEEDWPQGGWEAASLKNKAGEVMEVDGCKYTTLNLQERSRTIFGDRKW